MKTKLLALALGACVSFSAFAGPVVPLPPSPLYMKFNGNEQIANAGNTTWGTNTSISASVAAQTADIAANPLHAGEINWGVFTMTNVDYGVVTTPNDRISDSGTAFFNQSPATNNAQVTGMFYGVKTHAPNTLDPFPATSGFIDLYWRDLDFFTFTSNATTTPTVRTAYDQATGYTEGDLLVHLAFASGIDADGSIFISGSVVPGPTNFHGLAASYANVLGTDGFWASQLNSDYFNTVFGTRDIRFDNIYQNRAAWNGPGITGAELNDPAQAFALPEPGALSLMGLALVGMGAMRRRKQK